MHAEFDPNDLFDVPDPYADVATRLKAPELDALPESPTRSRFRAIRIGSFAGILVIGALWLAATGVRDADTVTSALVILGLALPLVGALFATVIATSGGATRHRAVAAVAVAMFLFLVSSMVTHAPGDPSLRGMALCAAGGGMMTVLPVLLVLFAHRHAFATGAVWRTASLGLVSGIVGAAALRLHCPNDAMLHVLLGHGVPVLLVTWVAARFGPRVTRA